MIKTAVKKLLQSLDSLVQAEVQSLEKALERPTWVEAGDGFHCWWRERVKGGNEQSTLDQSLAWEAWCAALCWNNSRGR